MRLAALLSAAGLASPPALAPLRSCAPTLGLLDRFAAGLARGFENDQSLASSRPDYTAGLSGKNAPKYVQKHKREAEYRAMRNQVPIKFAGGRGGVVKPGANLLKEARRHGMKVKSDCQRGECGTCEVRLDGRVVCARTSDRSADPGHSVATTASRFGRARRCAHA